MEELAIKSVNPSSGGDTDSIVPNPDLKDFPRNIEGLQMTASRSLNSNLDLNKVDETRGTIKIEVGDFSVNEGTLNGKHALITDTTKFEAKVGIWNWKANLNVFAKDENFGSAEWPKLHSVEVKLGEYTT